MSLPKLQSCPNCHYSCNTPNDDSTNVYSCGICGQYYCHECNYNREMNFCPHCNGRTKKYFIEGWVGMTGDERGDYYREQDEMRRIRQSKRQVNKIKSSPPRVSVNFDSIKIIHNTQVGDGTKGMRILSTVRVNYYFGEFKPVAWFYDKNGNKLKDTNGKYSTKDKQVCAGFPKYKSKGGNSNPVKIEKFIPYTELHLKGSGVFKLYFVIGTFYAGSSNKIGNNSYRITFKVRKKVSGGFFTATKISYHSEDD